MKTDLLTQLAEYGTDHEERHQAVTADEILGAVVPLPVRATRPVSRRAVGVALAAAAAVAIVVALPFLFTRSDSQPSQSSTVTTAPTTTVAPTTTSAAEATPTTVAPTGSAVQPEEEKVELLSVVLEVGEILELPVVRIGADRGDTSAGIVMDVDGWFDTGQPGNELGLGIVAFETPEAASAWLTTQTRLEDQDFSEDFPLPDTLALGDESGVERQCGRGCTTRHYVRVAAHVVRTAGHEDFDVASIAATALSALDSGYAPQLEVSTASIPAPQTIEPLGIWITATDESGVPVVWQVPDREFWEAHVLQGHGCYVSRESVDPVRGGGAFERFRITPEGTHERGLGDGFPLRWEVADETEPPFDDVRALCELESMLSTIDLGQDIPPSHWEITDIVGDGSYTAAEVVNGYRLDANQVASAGLLPADSTLTLVAADLSVADLSPTILQIVVRGSHPAAREALGLTFRELDPNGTVTVEYLLEDR